MEVRCDVYLCYVTDFDGGDVLWYIQSIIMATGGRG